MAATDARPVPKKNTAFRWYFAIRKADGNLVTGWTNADSERSLDGAAFSDCANEATEIGSSGCGFIDLTAAEMNTDATMLKVTVTNTDARDYVVTLFPEDNGDIRTQPSSVAANAINAAAIAANAITSDKIAANAITSSQLATDCIGSAQLAADCITASQLADNAITAATFATDAITAAALNGDAVEEITDAVWDEPISGHSTAGTTGLILQDASAAASAATSNMSAIAAYKDNLVTFLSEKPANWSLLSIDVSGQVSSANVVPASVIADAVWDEQLSGHAGAGSAGKALSDSGAVDAIAIAAAVWDKPISEHTDANAFGGWVQGGIVGEIDNVPSNVWAESGRSLDSPVTVTGNVTVGDLTAIALSKFANVDTGETATVDGSVAKLSQGAAGGNVTVGAMTQAALAQFASTDTGQTVTVGGSVARLSRAPLVSGVGGVLEIGPTVVTSTRFAIVQGDDYSAGDGRAIDFDSLSDDEWPDLTGATVRLGCPSLPELNDAALSVEAATGAQKVRLEIANAVTSELQSGEHKFDVEATLTNGRVITLRRGECAVELSYSN